MVMFGGSRKWIAGHRLTLDSRNKWVLEIGGAFGEKRETRWEVESLVSCHGEGL